MSIIKVSDLTFCYEGSYDNIFENVSFQLDTDWRLGLTGRNGRGKNTPLPIDGTVLLYYLLYFFFRLTTVVPITAPPLMNRSALHKTGSLLSPVFDEAVFPDLSGWSLGFTVEPFAGIATAAFL